MSQLSHYPITLDGKSVDEKRRQIWEYFHNTFTLFEKVFDVLKSEEVFYRQSELTRHPMIFYFGHTATFFINKLIHMKVISQRINPLYESIFAVGVDEMAWDDLNEENYQWPKVEDVRKYRQEVRTVVDNLIMTLPLELPIKEDSAMWILLMGIEHEKIHIETSLVLHRQMPIESVQTTLEFSVCEVTSKAPLNEMVAIESSTVELGKDKEHHLYGWDNEYGTYKESVARFKVSKYLVSNGEYLEFVQEGGYKDSRYWSEEGKKFLELTNAQHPHFWIPKNKTYRYRTLTSEIDMPQNWPVDVNALEAEAFCRYKSLKEGVEYQLPSEAEYRVIQDAVGLEDVPLFDEKSANVNFAHYASSTPVDTFGFELKNGQKIYDVVGNVWQWSRTAIFGFNGFCVHEAYEDFSTPTFDEKHALLLGSSWASGGNLMVKHSRYAFRRHFFQHAGFRYVISQQKENKIENEGDILALKKAEAEYSEKNFLNQNIQTISGFVKDRSKALDLGCVTGRTTFELGKYFQSVDGVDLSVRFIQIGVRLKEEGYLIFTTGSHATLQELGYEKSSQRVSFWQGDACNLKPSFNEYNCIMVNNTWKRLYDEKHFISTIHSRLNKGGVLAFVSLPLSKEVENILSDKFEFLHKENVSNTSLELSIYRRREEG